MRLPTEEECKTLFEAAIKGIDWANYERVYATDYDMGTMYLYAMGAGMQTDFAIKICKNYDGFLAGMKRRLGGHHGWDIALFDVVKFSQVASEMFKNWDWR